MRRTSRVQALRLPDVPHDVRVALVVLPWALPLTWFAFTILAAGGAR